MKKYFWVIGACSLSLAVLGPLWAEEVRLKSGKIVNGEVIERTPSYIRLNVEGIEVTYWKDSLASEELPAPEVVQETAKAPATGSGETVSGPATSETYLAYMKAVEDKDWQEVKKFLTHYYVLEKEAADRKSPSSWADINQFTSKDFKIITERNEEDGSKTLIVRGELLEGKGRAFVRMVDEDGVWKIDRIIWKLGGKRPAGKRAAALNERKDHE